MDHLNREVEMLRTTGRLTPWFVVVIAMVFVAPLVVAEVPDSVDDPDVVVCNFWDSGSHCCVCEFIDDPHGPVPTERECVSRDDGYEKCGTTFLDDGCMTNWVTCRIVN